jgi:hypothetical protein
MEGSPSGNEDIVCDKESSQKGDFGQSRLLQEYLSWRGSFGLFDELDSLISHTKQELCQLVLDHISRMDKDDRDRATFILFLVMAGRRTGVSCQGISDALALDADPLRFKENRSQIDPECEIFRLCGPLVTCSGVTGPPYLSDHDLPWSFLRSRPTLHFSNRNLILSKKFLTIFINHPPKTDDHSYADFYRYCEWNWGRYY